MHADHASPFATVILPRDPQIAALFKRCTELGITMLNTCEFYGADRANERLIGEAIAFSPPSFHISLKVGAVGDIDSGLRMESSPARLKESVDTALALLGVPCIDLLVQARQDPNTPLEEVMRCFKELVEAGAAASAAPAAGSHTCMPRQVHAWLELMRRFDDAGVAPPTPPLPLAAVYLCLAACMHGSVRPGHWIH